MLYSGFAPPRQPGARTDGRHNRSTRGRSRSGRYPVSGRPLRPPRRPRSACGRTGWTRPGAGRGDAATRADRAGGKRGRRAEGDQRAARPAPDDGAQVVAPLRRAPAGRAARRAPLRHAVHHRRRPHRGGDRAHAGKPAAGRHTLEFARYGEGERPVGLDGAARLARVRPDDLPRQPDGRHWSRGSCRGATAGLLWDTEHENGRPVGATFGGDQTVCDDAFAPCQSKEVSYSQCVNHGHKGFAISA